MQGGNFRELLVGKILAVALSQFGECGAGNGHRGLPAVQQENRIDTVTVARGNGSVKMDKSNLDRRA